MKTAVVNANSIERKWYLVDAQNKVLGRLASKIATILIGKGKAAYSPNQDHGDYVIVINTDKILLTGNKEEKKSYFRHSRYPGGQTIRSFKEQMALDSTKVVRDAIHGMLAKKSLGRSMITKLHLYKDTTHPHQAQKPEAIVL